MLELTKHQNSVGQVLHDGSRLISSGMLNQNEDAEVRKQMKLLNDKWEALRIKAVERQAQLHEQLMRLQTEQLNQMDIWLSATEQRIGKLETLADSLEGLNEQKDEISQLQDDLIREQEAVDCLKQIIVVVDDSNDDQSFMDLENRLSNLSDRWSNVCKFVGNRWLSLQDLILKLNSLNSDFNDISVWIDDKSGQLKELISKLADDGLISDAPPGSDDAKSPRASDSAPIGLIELIKTLKDIEADMQRMHAKLNEMNDLGEKIGMQLNNSPQLTNSLNAKMDTLETKWNDLLYYMEFLSKKCCELQQLEVARARLNEEKVVTSQVAQNICESVSVEQLAPKMQTSNLSSNEQKAKYEGIVNELIRVFNKIDEFVNANNNLDLTLDEQHEIIKVKKATKKCTICNFLFIFFYFYYFQNSILLFFSIYFSRLTKFFAFFVFNIFRKLCLKFR